MRSLLIISAALIPLVGGLASAEATKPAVDVPTSITAVLKRAESAKGFEARAKILNAAAREMVALPEEELGILHREALAYALRRETASNKDRVRYITSAMKATLSDLRFKPRMEAAQPPGFPAPGPVGKVVAKTYPAYRLARAKGGGSFWTLFQHIKSNKVEMTAPVEMTMSDGMRELDMAFLYERPDQGKTGTQGRVAVVDVPAKTYLSIGFRGGRSQALMKRAKAWLEKRAAAEGWERDGSFRSMGYNSPMVRGSARYWEVQMPVKRKVVTPTKTAPQ